MAAFGIGVLVQVAVKIARGLTPTVEVMGMVGPARVGRESLLGAYGALEAGLRRRLRPRPASDAPVLPPVPRTSSRRSYRDLSRPPCDA
jgi:hypothetical protein